MAAAGAEVQVLHSNVVACVDEQQAAQAVLHQRQWPCWPACGVGIELPAPACTVLLSFGRAQAGIAPHTICQPT